MKTHMFKLSFVILVTAIILAGCGSPAQTPTSAPPTPTPLPTDPPTSAPTATAIATATVMPTVTSTPTASLVPPTATRVSATTPMPTVTRALPTATRTATLTPVPGSAEFYLDRGLLNAMSSNADALADFNQAIQLKPNYAEAYYWRGVTYSRMGQQDRALEEFSQAIRLKPDYGMAYIQKALIYSYRNETERALAEYDLAVKNQPNENTYSWRALAFYRDGQYDRSIADYTQLIQLQPTDADWYWERGIVLAETGEFERAIADFDQAIVVSPNSLPWYMDEFWSAYEWRGIVYYLQGEYDKAAADFTKAYRGSTSFELEPVLKAVAHAKLVANTRPVSIDERKAIVAEYFTLYAVMNIAMADDHDTAMDYVNRAIKLKPDYAPAYAFRSQLYRYLATEFKRSWAQGFADADREYALKAIAKYSEQIQLNPNDASAFFDRGMTYQSMNEMQKSIADMKKILELTNDQYWRERVEWELDFLGANSSPAPTPTRAN